MRDPKEIKVGEKTLAQVLADHVTWLTTDAAEGCANLSGACLSGANLHGAENILSIGPGGSRGGMLYGVKHETCIMVKTGCFWGTLEEFKTAVEKTHGDNAHGKYYAVAGYLISVYFQEK